MNKIKNIKDKIFKSDKKTKNLLSNISISFVLKGLALILNLILMPLYIKFFNNDIILGVWFTLISLLNYICSFDIGIGNGLRNILVEPINKDDKKEIKKIISTSYISVFLIGIIITIIFILIFKKIPWMQILNVEVGAIQYNDLKIMVFSIFIGVVIHFMLNLVNPICYSMQKSFMPSLILNATNIIVIVFLFLYKYIGFENKIIYMSIANIVSVALPYIVATTILFSGKLKGCFVSIKLFDKAYLKKIIGLGSKFLYLQVVSLIIFSTNEYLISYFSSPSNVVTFQVYNKIFYAISSIFNMMLVSLWSAVKEAIVQNDYKWISNIYKKINMLWKLSAVPLIGIILLYKIILRIWLGNDSGINVNYLYLIVFGVYYFLYMKINILSNFVNGMESFKINTIATTIVSILKIGLIIIAYKFVNDWIYIILITTVLLVPYNIFLEIDVKNKLKKGTNL